MVADRLISPIFIHCRDNTNDTSDTEGESGTQYWNESANESGSDTEEEGYSDVDEDDESRTKESKIQEEATPEVSLMDIRWKEQGWRKQSSWGYGKGSKISLQKQRKSARDFEREGSQTYNIEVLWQQSRNLGLIFAANSQVKPSQLLPNESISSAFSLSNIP